MNQLEVLLFVLGRHPFVSDGEELPAVSDVNVTLVPSDFVNTKRLPTGMLA